jgi:hypothetical protein
MADENNHALKVSSDKAQLAAAEIQQQKNKLLPSVEAYLLLQWRWLAGRYNLIFD